MNDLRETAVIFSTILCFRFRSSVNFPPAEKKSPNILSESSRILLLYRKGRKRTSLEYRFLYARKKSANAN